jgi:major type 1 subunit fimbrin (pilin)
MKAVAVVLFFCCFFQIPQASAASCNFFSGHRLYTMNVDIPAKLSIPRDTPNGTVIFESRTVTLASPPNSFQCATDSPYGVQNEVGPTNAELKYLPIGNTGLAWQWGRNDNDIAAIYPNDTTKAGGYGYDKTRHRLRIIKVADTNETQKIPPGTLGHTTVGGLAVLAMSTSGMTILPQSCETPDVKVDMGSNDLSVFSEYGKHSDPVMFNIKLSNCPKGINKIFYSLVPTSGSPAVGAGDGMVALNKSSTAKGIALQILDENQTPIELSKEYGFLGYSAAGGNFNIPLFARFFRTVPTGKSGGFDPGMSSGTANADIWFIMNYL